MRSNYENICEWQELKEEVAFLTLDVLFENEFLEKFNCDSFNDLEKHIRQLEKENSELKARLENAIEPKFMRGDRVYVIEPSINENCELDIYKVCLNNITKTITYDYAFNGEMIIDEEGHESYEADIGMADECDIFATKKEAEKELKRRII